MLFARAVNADCVQAQPGEGAVCQWHTTKAPTEAAAKTQGEEPWSPSAEGETLFSVGRIFGGELQNIPGGCFARGPLLKEKRGPEYVPDAAFLRPPEGGIETTGDSRDEKTAEQKKGPCLAPDDACLRFPGRGNRNHRGWKREKTAEQKKGPCLAPDDACLRFPGRGNRNHRGWKRRKNSRAEKGALPGS